MAYQLDRLGTDCTPALTDAELLDRVDRLIRIEQPRFRRLWAYVHNPSQPAADGIGVGGADRPYRQAQEWGLPARITGVRRTNAELFAGQAVEEVARKEVVIENDIGWRIETLVDYLFGKPLVIESAAPDPARRAIIGQLLRQVLAQNGGNTLLQQIALIGSVYGFVDVLVKFVAPPDGITKEFVENHSSGNVALAVNGCGTARDLGEPPAADTGGAAAGGRRGTPTRQSSHDEQDVSHQHADADASAPRAASGATSGSDVNGAPQPVATHSAGRTETAARPTSDNNPSADDAAPVTPPSAPDAGSATNPPDASSSTTSDARVTSPEALIMRLARLVRLEIIEPSRALPFLSPGDYRSVRAYALFSANDADASNQPVSGADRLRAGSADEPGGLTGSESTSSVVGRASWIERLRDRLAGGHLSRGWPRRDSRGHDPRRSVHASAIAPDAVIDILTATRWQRYVNHRLVAEGPNALGQIPLVHVQNSAIPFEYSGGSDVEPLIPLQDELNTRLSDRANRITLQCFKMYLGKGIDAFTEMPVAPGRMWASDNPDAEVIEFGGDAASPSEDAHIADLREALDKTSGVTPIAAGAIKGRIGNLTSAAALRVTMQALLARTEKKRTTYGAAIARICELALAWLDAFGLFHTNEQERRIEINWPSPLPENQQEKLQEAEAKLRIGVPREIVLRELGY